MTTIKRIAERIMREQQSLRPPAWQFLRNSPAWLLVRSPTWSLSSAAAARLNSALRPLPEPLTLQQLRTWTVLQQQLRVSLLLLEQLAPPIRPAARLQETRQLLDAFSETRFAELKEGLAPLEDREAIEIQALADRFSEALVDLPPDQGRRWCVELLAATILSGCPKQIEEMSDEVAVEYIDDTMRIVLSVIEFWERQDLA
ncbi:hypothetical protein ACFWC2_00935 [Streptomyces diastaticus]|uniref:hypothetical protein n=1 Tax=Streptomyces diastaticus TaxID=1956 RepID=UPI0036567DF3